MSLTPLQERKLRQTEDQIIFLEKQTKKQDVLFAVQSAWMMVIGIYIVGYFFDLITEGKSLPAYVNDEGYGEIITGFIMWFIIDYFLFVKGGRSELKRTKKKLEQLKKRYGLTKETVS